MPPAVKVLAEQHSIPVFQPKSLKSLKLSPEQLTINNRPAITGNPETAAMCEALNAIKDLDVIVTVAYGKIIPTALLAFAPRGIINIHPSLLPRWRGAAPLQYTIFSGDNECGVALMKAEEGLDTGPVFACEKYPLSDLTTLAELHDMLSGKGAAMLLYHLDKIALGEITAKPQDDRDSTYADKWTTEDATISWDEPADVCLRRILASSPSPGARTFFKTIPPLVNEDVEIEMLKIYRAHILPEKAEGELTPGDVSPCKEAALCLVCGDRRLLAIDEAQLPGKKRLPISEILKGFSFQGVSFITPHGNEHQPCPTQANTVVDTLVNNDKGIS